MGSAVRAVPGAQRRAGEAARGPGRTRAPKARGPDRAQHPERWGDGAMPHRPEADSRSHQKGHFGANDLISAAGLSPEAHVCL